MKNRERPHHPFQLAIEQCWDGGRTPRILVLGDRPGVVLPRHVLAKHVRLATKPSVERDVTKAPPSTGFKPRVIDGGKKTED